MKSCFKQKLLTTHVSLNKKAEYYCNIGCGVCTRYATFVMNGTLSIWVKKTRNWMIGLYVTKMF